MAQYTVVSKRLLTVLPIRERIEVKLSRSVQSWDGTMEVLQRTYDVQLRIAIRDYTERDDAVFDCPAGDFNFFCFNKENRITCWPVAKGNQPLTNEGAWKKEGRQEMKPGRFLLLFAPYLKVYEHYTGDRVMDQSEVAAAINRACEIFTDRIRGQNADMVYQTSTDIASIYKMQEDERSGYLNNSCMRRGSGYNCSRYSAFYNTIPDLKIIYQTDPITDRLLFRALLWENVLTSNQERVTFLDRIYGSESLIQRLLTHAQEKEWAYRHFSNNETYHKGREVYLTKEVPTKTAMYAHKYGVPYVDTLRFMRYDCRTDKIVVTNEWIDSSRFRIEEMQACGGDSITIMDTCPKCGRMLTSKNSTTFHDTRICLSCFKKETTVCEDCGERHWSDSFVYIKDLGRAVCPSCISRYGYAFCRKCRSWKKNVDRIFGMMVCEDCMAQMPKCDCCHKPTPEEHLHTVGQDGQTHYRDPNPRYRICANCRNSIFYRCPVCGTRHMGQLQFEETDGAAVYEIQECTNQECINYRRRNRGLPQISTEHQLQEAMQALEMENQHYASAYARLQLISPLWEACITTEHQ